MQTTNRPCRVPALLVSLRLSFLLPAILCGPWLLSARAATYAWNPGASGLWSNGGLWTPLGPPGIADTADFSGAGIHNVNLGGSTPLTIDSITIGGLLPADTYFLTDSSNTGPSPFFSWNQLLVPTSITKNGNSSAYFNGTRIATALLTMNGGYLSIADTNLFQATTVNVNGGILCAGSVVAGATISAFNWNVNSGGTLKIQGTLFGTVNVVGTGVAVAGCSVNTAMIQGNLAFNSGTSSTFELATPNIVGGGVNDLFIVNGDLTLNGTLNVVALPGFGSGTYRLFNYTGTLTGPSPALGTMPPGYNYYVSTATAGQVNLLVSPIASVSYTNTILPGLNLIANQLDHGANTLFDVLPNPPAGSTVYKWDEGAQAFHVDTFDDLDGWMDANSGAASTTTLAAREAVFLSNPNTTSYQLVFTGTTRSQTPPPVLSRTRLHYLSGPINRPASYTDLTGLAPEEGAMLLRWQTGTQKYQTNRYTGGAWQPSEPAAGIGEGAALSLPSKAVTNLVSCGTAVATCYSGTYVGGGVPNPNGPVLAVVNVNNPAGSGAILGQNWATSMYHGEIVPAVPTWTRANLGEIFGVTLDGQNPPNIFVSAAGFYYGQPPGGPSGSGAVYRVDGVTAAISCHATLPNTGVGLGNICYHAQSGNFFVSNFEDGRIYRLPQTSTCGGSSFVFYDHGVTGRPFESLPALPDDGTPGATQLGRRVFGLQTFNGRLYYSVWNENGNNADTAYYSGTLANEIWSVGLDALGNFVTPARREITLPGAASVNPFFPNGQWSSPVSDIKFSDQGSKMLLSERSVDGAFPNVLPPPYNAHIARVLEYKLVGSVWTFVQQFHVGDNGSCDSSAGGADYACDSLIWATGDYLKALPPNYIYGMAGISAAGNLCATASATSYLVDFDGIFNINKTAIGDVVVRRCCPCVPPPSGLVGWWPLDETTGAPYYADFSGNGNAALVESGSVGSPSSPFAVSPGKVAGANYFINASSRGRALNSPSLNFGTGSFSVDAWVKAAGPVFNAWQPIVDKLNQTGPTTGKGYTVGFNSTGKVVLRVGDGNLYTYTSVNSVGNNVWTFIGVSYNRIVNEVTFHVNGVNEPPQTPSAAGTFDNVTDLLLGSSYDPNNVSETALDEIEIFNRALATNEFSALWVADAFGKCKDVPPCTNSVVSIFCPTNVTLQACGPTNIHYALPVAVSSCGTIVSVVCTPPSGFPFPPGTTIVTCTATDSLGATASCSFNVTVTPDTTPPVLDCACLVSNAHDVLFTNACQGAVPNLCQFTACFSDNCCLGSCAQSPNAGTLLGPGTHPITVIITDCAGNTNACVVNFVVVAPEQGCGPCPCPTNNLIVNGSFEVPAFPTGTDCQQILVGPGFMPGWTVSIDEIARCKFAAPYNVMPSDGLLFVDLTGFSDAPPHGAVTQTVPTTVGQCYRLTFDLGVNLDWPGLLDGPITVKVTVAGAISQTFTYNPSGLGTVWSNFVFLFAAPTASTTITLEGVSGKNFIGLDNVAMYCSCACSNCAVAVTCPTNRVVYSCSATPVSYPTPTATSTCGNTPTVTCVPPSGSTFPPGTNTVLCIANDGLGHLAACNFTVTVLPPPGVNCLHLEVVLAGTNIVLSWPSSASGFNLQQASELLGSDTVWTTITNAPATVADSRQVTLPRQGAMGFYRLMGLQ